MSTPNELLKQANIALQKAVDEKNNRKLESDRKFILAGIGKDLNNAIKPTLAQIARDNASVAREAIAEMKKAKMPDVVIPPIDIPQPQVDVNVDLSSLKVPQPKISVSPILRPDITFPKEMDIKGWVQLQGVDLGHPLPVQLRDADGKPVNLLENLTTIVGGGGGIAKIVKISQILDTVDVSVTGATGSIAATIIDSGGIGYSGDNPLPVVFGAGATTGSNIVDSGGVAYSGSNPVPVVFGAAATSASNVVDSSGVAYTGTNPFPITGDVAVSGITGTIGANIVDSDGEAYTTTNPLPIGDAGGSVTVDGTFWQVTQPVSGTVAVSGITDTVGSNIVDSDGEAYTTTNPVPVTILSGAGATTAGTILDGDGDYRDTFPVEGSVAVTGITGTIAANIVDSTGEAYTSTNPLPVDLETRLDSVNDSIGTLQVSGSISSVNVMEILGNPVRVGSGYQDNALRVVNATDAITSVNVVSSVAMTGTVAVSGITGTVGTNIVDSTGVGYSGSNPVPTRNGFDMPLYDYIALTETPETDVYLYKTGGVGGAEVGTITVVYVDETRTTTLTITLT